MPININNPDDTSLGRIGIIGQADQGQGKALWRLEARAERVPLHGSDNGTPAVHGLRTLWMRSIARYIGTDHNDVSYLDPTLLDAFVSEGDENGGKYSLNIFGRRANVTLDGEQRIDLTPLREQPDYQPPQPPDTKPELRVSPFLVAAGSLSIAAPSALLAILPDLDASERVDLDRDGIVYTAKVVTPIRDGAGPAGENRIASRVRLSLAGGALTLTLLPAELNPATTAAWLAEWRRLSALADGTRATAWARLNFEVGGTVPALTWPVTATGSVMTVDWANALLPPKLVTVTLADQPIESQLLGPEQVLTLIPEGVQIVSSGNKFMLKTPAIGVAELDYLYDAANKQKETLSFVKPLRMVHTPAQVCNALRAAYGSTPRDDAVLVGFMQEADGWVELPFAQNPSLPERMAAQSTADTSDVSAHGSLLVGTRRPELHEPGAVATQVPWSMRIDVPSDFQVEFAFVAGQLVTARVRLKGTAVQARGIVWLARRMPDGDDALPLIDAAPDSFFDVVLDRAAEGTAAAPFVLQGGPGLAMHAPARPASEQWDDRSVPRWKRAPSLAPEAGLIVDLPVLGRTIGANATSPAARAWLHHPMLPVIQCMPGTRSNPASPRPHASRGLSLFEQAGTRLNFSRMAGMAPAIDPVQRAAFKAVPGAGALPAPPALAVLSLPGIELEPATPASYPARGRYGLPVLDEVFARAVLPLPPGAEPPPVPAPVTALDQAALAAMWQEQQRRRGNAMPRSDLMFAPDKKNESAPLVAGALAGARSLSATASVSDVSSIVGGVLQMGSVTFAQAKPVWTWRASGDDLLAGPDAPLDFSTIGKVAIGAGGQRLLGWTFAERQADTLTFDGDGVGWDSATMVLGDVALRALSIEQQQGAVAARTLASTIEALAVGGTGTVMWRLAFTDLPMAGQGGGTWKPGSSEARLAGCEQGWTWSLYEAGAWQSTTLLLHRIFRFTPAALTSVTIGTNGVVSNVVVEGALALGSDETGLATHAGGRVQLTFARVGTALGLQLNGIAALDDADGRLRLDLRPEPASRAISSGVAQFSALPMLEDGALLLKEARLAATLFGSRSSIVLGDLKAGATELVYQEDAPDEVLVMGLTRLDLDLAAARVGRLGFAVELRQDLEVEVTETLSGGAVASVNWFGNATSWAIDIDDLRRTLRLWVPEPESEQARQAIQFFPYVPSGRIDAGMLCLTLDPPRKNALFAVATHFFEAIFQVSDELRVSHLMHSDGERGPVDMLRFDGTLTRTNLVTWPDLNTGAVGGASSIDVEFATADVVVHSAAFLLSDHRLPGSAVHKALSKGLALSEPIPGSAPVAWLAEATHTLNWHKGGVGGAPGPARRLQCLQTLQLWGGAQLKEALVQHGRQFGFTASYAGTHSDTFPNAGVRKVELGFTGLFEQGISLAIGELRESWLMLGNMTALCPGTGDSALFLPLHLPFIGALGEAPQLDPVRIALGVPKQSAASTLRMSRHDTLGLPMRIDASLATPAGMLASLPRVMTVPFALAALPAETLSGEALAAGWMNRNGLAVEAGLHVEQIQHPGPASGRARAPHPFARAAVMLDYYRRWSAHKELPALSVLVQSTGPGSDYAVKVRTVQIQPPPTGDAEISHEAAVELIVGSAQGLKVLVVDADLAGAGHARQLQAIAMEHTGQPTFLVLRRASATQATGQACSYTGIELPARVADQLTHPARALRPAQSVGTDGRLTWPEASTEGSGQKMHLLTGWAPREPFQHRALGVAGLRGRILPAREAGEIFGFAGPLGPDASGTVWLQEWEKVAFAGGAPDPEDAPPAAFDRPVPARPLAPTVRAVAAAIGRMDSAAAKAGSAIMQTYLPPLIEDVDLPSRLGTITQSGLRALRTWDDGKQRDDAPALAGSAQTRSMRPPRPVAIPANLGHSRLWARTVGWYGKADASCLVMQGAWDMLAADPGPDGIPPWCILIGKLARARLEPMVQHQEQGWRGAVRVACEVLVPGGDGQPARHPDPAFFILDALFAAAASVRAGLRTAQQWLPFYGASAIDSHTIEFIMKKDAARLSTATAYSFECGWQVANGPFEGAGPKSLLLPPYQAPTTLDPTAFHKLSLPLGAARAHQYPLPLIERSVFFSDPAFDQQLSRTKGLSDSLRLKDRDVSFWLDRPSATPAETLVLRAASIDKLPATFALSAAIKRKANSDPASAELLFQFEHSPKLIEIANGAWLSLPLSMLADTEGRGVAPGDILRLELKEPAAEPTWALVLFLSIRDQSALAAPQALYSLIAVDPSAPRAWCDRHSAAPQPEGLATHIVTGDEGERISRRALFKWRTTRKSDAPKLGFSICKVDLATESIHVPDTVEWEFTAD